MDAQRNAPVYIPTHAQSPFRLTDNRGRSTDAILRMKGGHRLRNTLIRTGVIGRGRPRAYWFTGSPNFGDELSEAILAWVCGAKPIWVPKTYQRKILAIGSILQSALAPSDVVWGSGLIRDQTLIPPDGVEFLAVRGPLTRSRILGDVPATYGDPALLLPRFYSPFVDKRFPIGVVPHYVDREAVEITDPAVCVIDVRQPWPQVVDAIRACETIVSSSLHGLIVAETYGIPATWVEITGLVIGDGFKFNDYLLATGRDEEAPVSWDRGIAHAADNSLSLPRFDSNPLLSAANSLMQSTS